ncbi:hypothetical protein HYDPIDRAFT_168202 [Hydnomerulius pinastri MD-312]|uniref:Uncharacterized protein n=1 Tax=Hydnomerulius pinastri MD-312 TaxID=994086 RepID=A0A0C9VDZ0_9AGAM|nr:hypothetical protein HYDPIDRAFT_168202 [Hydnomerulius pinastri MD-312]
MHWGGEYGGCQKEKEGQMPAGSARKLWTKNMEMARQYPELALCYTSWQNHHMALSSGKPKSVKGEARNDDAISYSSSKETASNASNLDSFLSHSMNEGNNPETSTPASKAQFQNSSKTFDVQMPDISKAITNPTATMTTTPAEVPTSNPSAIPSTKGLISDQLAPSTVALAQPVSPILDSTPAFSPTASSISLPTAPAPAPPTNEASALLPSAPLPAATTSIPSTNEVSTGTTTTKKAHRMQVSKLKTQNGCKEKSFTAKKFQAHWKSLFGNNKDDWERQAKELVAQGNWPRF